MNILEDEWYIVIKTDKFKFFAILRDGFTQARAQGCTATTAPSYSSGHAPFCTTIYYRTICTIYQLYDNRSMHVLKFLPLSTYLQFLHHLSWVPIVILYTVLLLIVNTNNFYRYS